VPVFAPVDVCSWPDSESPATADYKNMIENAGSIAASSTPGQLGDVIAQTLDEVAATMREFGPQQKQ
jgi:hypothetical protein